MCLGFPFELWRRLVDETTLPREMGESAVLVHSYSFAAPLTRNDSHEENTIHALSQSISFGKFMTENLEWGKWSSFSHKKYVEEAEKYSRPGSVAQKKAFFEAHYKRIAEAKKAATQEQPTVTPAQLLLHTLEPHPPLPTHDEATIHEVDSQGNENGLVDRKPEEDWSVAENKKERRSITKNKPVFRLSLDKTIPPTSLETETALPEKTSAKPMTQVLDKNQDKRAHRQRFSLLSCFMGSAKAQAQDQNESRKKRKADKKKQYLCLCLKPKTARES